jgi:hypothetical protein
MTAATVVRPRRAKRYRDGVSDAEIRRWFAKHKAEYSAAAVGGVQVERLVWKQPGTWTYRVDYTCIGGTVLCVAGDLGEAVYNTGAQSLEWWGRCDRSYFASKCFASESGRGYKDWSADEARRRLKESVTSSRHDGHKIDKADVEAALRAIDDGRGGWDAWMREEAYRVFGDDWWDFVPNFGVIIAPRCAAHLLGLKMALASLATERDSAPNKPDGATDATTTATPSANSNVGAARG